MMPHPPPVDPPVLLGVWAHPDDEAYLSAGTMARWTDAGGRAVCCTATRGERGIDPLDRSPVEFGRHRERELRAALAVVGAELTGVLGLPDGACDEAPAAAPTQVLAALMVATRPERVLTFGPDGLTGHSDHRAVSRWVTTAWRTARRIDPSIGELHYATLTEGFVARHRAWHDEIGLFEERPGVPATTADERVSLRVELDPVERDRKRRALGAHRSQTEQLARRMDDTFGPGSYRDWFAAEWFRAPTAAELAGVAPLGGATEWSPRSRPRAGVPA